MEKKKPVSQEIKKISSQTDRTATKEEIQKVFEKAVKTHGKTLEKLSKN
jgi:hypothetical protein